MESFFVGPFGLFLMILQAAFFSCVMREMFGSRTNEDGGVVRFRRVGGFGPFSARAHPEKTFEIRYDAVGKTITAEVVSGPFAGQRLDELGEAELAWLRDQCGARDAQARDILDAYRQQRFSQSWADDRQRARAAPPSRREGDLTLEQAARILGLKVGASAADICRAHRALIGRHHPDRGGSHAEAAQINRARDVLIGVSERWQAAA